MSSQSEILPRSPASPVPPSLAAPEPPPPAAPAPNRRNGKIPHLPKEHRDLINHYFDDGLTYQAVSRKLAEQGISINGANLSAWYNGGYQDHLRQTERCALLADSQQRLLDLALKHDAPALASVGLQLAVTQLAQQLADLAPGSHKDAFQNDSTLYLRMLNSLARMSKALLSLEQYHDACAQAVAAELKQMNTDRELADNEFQLVVKRMDRVFKVARPSSAAPASTGNPVPRVAQASLPPSGAGVPPVSWAVSPPPSTPSVPPVPEPATCNPQPSTADLLPPRSEGVPPASPEASPPQCPAAPQPAGEGAPAPVPEPATCNLQPATDSANSELKTQNSKLLPAPSPSDEETCYDCAVTLPPLLPDGQRPSNTCRRCGAKLYPPGTKFDHCPFCDAAQPLPNNERISPDCRRCGGVLPPPGQRYVENCPGCGLKLPNITNEGTRLSPRCSDCGAVLPLLEPAPCLS